MTKLSEDDRKKIYDLITRRGFSAKTVIADHFPGVSRQTISSTVKKIRAQEGSGTPTYSVKNYESSSEEESSSEGSGYTSEVETVISAYLPTYSPGPERKEMVMENKQEMPMPPARGFGGEPRVRINTTPPPPQSPIGRRRREEMCSDPTGARERALEHRPTGARERALEYRPTAKRNELLTRIDAYTEQFRGKFLDIIGDSEREWKQSLKTYSEEDLENLLDVIRAKISSSGLRSGIHQIFFTATGVAENIGCSAGLKLQGFSQSLERNESLRSAIDELSIEYMSFSTISPGKRVLFLLVMAAVNTHSLNSKDERMSEVLNQEVPAAKAEEFADL